MDEQEQVPGTARAMGAAALRVVPYLLAAVALAAAAAGVAQLLWHGRLFAARVPFPLDLEWMEGGTLLHAQRLAEGKAIYVKPSLEFIPFLYTPFYPALLAALSKVFPLGYLLGRVVSVLAFTAALGLLVAGAAREGWHGGKLQRAVVLLAGVAGAGAVMGGFEFTGAFYDLVRGDSLLLALEAGALAAAVWGRSWQSAVVAALAMWLAFLTKQTGPLIGVGIGLGLLVASWRRALVYGAVCAVTMGLSLLYLVWSSEGWFWTYIFKLHQSHPFRHDTLAKTPVWIWRHEWPTLLALVLSTVGLALGRRLRRTDAILWGAALAGIAAGIVGFATMWAHTNAFIPATYFPVFAAATLSARLLAHALETRKAGAVAVAAACALGLGAHSLRAGQPLHAARMPVAADREAAGRFLERLRALPGDGFIPFHPYYSVLAGKRPFTHRMGVMDVAAALGRPAGLDQAVFAQRFPWIILDWKSMPGEWPGVDSRYHLVHELRDGFDAVRTFSGADTSPRWVMLPVRDPPALPPGGVRLADFESSRFDGWTREGDAFGSAPAASPTELYGRYAANSARFGPAHTGSLRSVPLQLTKPHLSMTVLAPADPGLRVLLLVGQETARSASPPGGVGKITWDVTDLVGKKVELLIDDRSTTGGIVVDEIIAY